ncbi:MAG TPA: peroxide stress protein YaaA [Lachnoclostridium phytofermentans]|uniref:UPF0246 protein DHW61_13470 n=1 Tax=Lachnoclostridium phytofermentans TaxID=66219 RepID=A0A3D2X8Y8_9FIRM|nr:peroxide stress protein YaaA [Lachnoclostridium sp.]HCL03394.1 peroxide stress protein YaaA [Lachnoclostridium phytofermentans]
MRIIISPAKKMVENIEAFPVCGEPSLLEHTNHLLAYLKSLNYEEAKELWNCNDHLAIKNFDRITNMDLKTNLTPAILSYQGLQYQYMAPEVLEKDQLEYIQEHLFILSGFYGILKPLDGVTAYRLEMQAKVNLSDKKDLYEFWGSLLYDKLCKETDLILNLASKEYSKCIERYATEDVKLVTCIFGERKGEKVIEKGTYAKMARGEMVRYMAEHKISTISEVKKFDRLDFSYDENLSDETKLVFMKGESNVRDRK